MLEATILNRKSCIKMEAESGMLWSSMLEDRMLEDSMLCEVACRGQAAFGTAYDRIGLSTPTVYPA
jgi:hypothetical protein